MEKFEQFWMMIKADKIVCDRNDVAGVGHAEADLKVPFEC